MSDRRREALDYLESHHVMTLATSGVEGPWAAAVFYVNDGFRLYFLSSLRSRHGGDLDAAGRCAAAIQEDYPDWPDIKGIQIEGQVRRLSGMDRAAAIALYAKKFPVVRPDRAPELIRAALERIAWFELIPERCFFIDNSRGFGHRDEIPI